MGESKLERLYSYGSIDSMISRELDWKLPKWNNDVLYSWIWGLGNNYLDPRMVYGRSLGEFNVDTFKFSSLAEVSPGNIAVMKAFYKDNGMLLYKKRDVLLDLLVEGEDIARSYHVVVTNMRPDKSLFAKGLLYSGRGAWNSEYR